MKAPRDLERLISATLRGGVLLSIATIVLGVVLTFLHHPDYFRSRPALGELLDARASYTSSIGGVLSGISQGHGQSIVMLGILILIATPVVRVAMSVAIFAAQRDRRYVAITLTVLVLLLVSFLSGAAG